jgi:hypothetical protein
MPFVIVDSTLYATANDVSPAFELNKKNRSLITNG